MYVALQPEAVRLEAQLLPRGALLLTVPPWAFPAHSLKLNGSHAESSRQPSCGAYCHLSVPNFCMFDVLILKPSRVWRTESTCCRFKLCPLTHSWWDLVCMSCCQMALNHWWYTHDCPTRRYKLPSGTVMHIPLMGQAGGNVLLKLQKEEFILSAPVRPTV